LVEQGHAVVVVHRVLVHMDSDVCPACFGRGYKVVPGTPMLSEEECVECKGAGRREIQGEAEQALVDLIKRLEREIGVALMQKLSSRL
jgi:DnaJ-class molecular chaperone